MLDRFMKTYVGLSPAEKKMTAVVLDGIPYSWNVCYNEIKHNTATGRQMQSYLERNGLI